MKFNLAFGLLLFTLLGLFGCSEPPFRIHEKLDGLLQSDLRYMTGEVMKGSGFRHLLERPYYIVRDLRFFSGDTAYYYSAYAEVDFFYFKDVAIFQKRKYRYDARYSYWDRYFKKEMFLTAPPKEPSEFVKKTEK
ncbi:MAG TPA: hypothetical protein VLM37_09025 [Fibrobacteraceae bacterium]|nr:hypothetical protein [Fibrobacteraceae bacterium]